ncbi:hypothetical protein [uncultured Campylobacter sp.]|uniref:hypothetical protein n=1 Tax=uncultured Campylobacter sp. TaxID=218934 RepID=UPI00261171DF|nr:hypothetical protein [uncultured Campylobacter sp.]
MQKTLAIMRTHKINEAIISEFAKMQNCGVDTLLLINNSYGAVENDKSTKIKELEMFGTKVKCLVLYQQDYIELGFYNFDDVGYNFWFNVTYGLFIAKQYFDSYDYYWYFDYDVFLNAPNYKDFFDFYKKDDADFIISHFRKESYDKTSWCWITNTQWAYYDSKVFLHGCLFSNERYSARFVNHIFEKYKEMTQKFQQFNGNKQWLHPEFMCATEAVKYGFKIRNFTDDGHYISLAPHYVDLNNRLFLKPDNKMYHPCKPDIVSEIYNNLHNCQTHISSLNNLLNFTKEFGTAKARIHNHLAYKLGLALIENSKSIKGYIRLPYVLSYIKDKHKKEQKIYNEKIKDNPSLKLPPLESYPDYKDALREKNCITYKLGEALIENMKRGGALKYIRFMKDVRRIKKVFKKV